MFNIVGGFNRALATVLPPTVPLPEISINLFGTLVDGDTGTITASTVNADSVQWSSTGVVAINANTGNYVVNGVGDFTITATAVNQGGSESSSVSGTIEAVVVTSTLVMSGRRIPDDYHDTRVINPLTSKVEYLGSLPWQGSSASVVLQGVPANTLLEWYVIGNKTGTLNRGTTQ